MDNTEKKPRRRRYSQDTDVVTSDITHEVMDVSDLGNTGISDVNADEGVPDDSNQSSDGDVPCIDNAQIVIHDDPDVDANVASASASASDADADSGADDADADADANADANANANADVDTLCMNFKFGVRLYNTACSKVPIQRISGTYYIWDSTVYCGRIRVCETQSAAHDPNRCIGWVNMCEIDRYRK